MERKNYMNLLINTLKENVQKTSNLNMDTMDSVITHFGLKLEEECLAKRGWGSYTEAITRARIKIENCTLHNTLYPVIADAMQVEQKEVAQKMPDQNVVNNNNEKDVTLDKEQNVTVTSLYTVGDDGVVNINSSDEDDDIVREILISVQTEPSD